MSTTVPNWTDNDQTLQAVVVSFGQNPQASGAETGLDLKAKFGAWIFIGGMREDDTAIDTPIKYNVRRGPDSERYHPNSPFDRVGGTVTAADTTVDGDSAADQAILNVALTTGFAAGDLIAIGAADGTRLEFAKVSKITNPGAGGELILDRGLESEHTAVQADVVTNQADLFQMWLAGGSVYEISADYGEAASGPDMTVRVRSQIWDNVETT